MKRGRSSFEQHHNTTEQKKESVRCNEYASVLSSEHAASCLTALPHQLLLKAGCSMIAEDNKQNLQPVMATPLCACKPCLNCVHATNKGLAAAVMRIQESHARATCPCYPHIQHHVTKVC